MPAQSLCHEALRVQKNLLWDEGERQVVGLKGLKIQSRLGREWAGQVKAGSRDLQSTARCPLENWGAEFSFALKNGVRA